MHPAEWLNFTGNAWLDGVLVGVFVSLTLWSR